MTAPYGASYWSENIELLKELYGNAALPPLGDFKFSISVDVTGNKDESASQTYPNAMMMGDDLPAGLRLAEYALIGYKFPSDTNARNSNWYYRSDNSFFADYSSLYRDNERLYFSSGTNRPTVGEVTGTGNQTSLKVYRNVANHSGVITAYFNVLVPNDAADGTVYANRSYAKLNTGKSLGTFDLGTFTNDVPKSPIAAHLPEIYTNTTYDANTGVTSNSQQWKHLDDPEWFTTYYSNYTYHTVGKAPPAAEPAGVVEKYHILNTSTELKSDKTTVKNKGEDFYPDTTAPQEINSTDGKTYRYQGYKLDGGPVVYTKTDVPPDMTDLQEDHTIIYYYMPDVKVIEHYREMTGADTMTTNVIKNDTEVFVPWSAGYTAGIDRRDNITKDGRTYTYQGYSLDGPVGGPPAGADPTVYVSGDTQSPTYTGVEEERNIFFYFKRDPHVTVIYRDLDNPSTLPDDELKARTDSSVPLQGSYYPSPSNWLPIGSFNYWGYQRVGTEAAPVRGNPPNPSWSNMEDDETIIYYFRNVPVVTVHFVEIGNESSILRNDETLYPAASGDPVSIPLSFLDDILRANGKTYQYKGWKIDAGAYTTGDPTDPAIAGVTANQEITLYFQTTYLITEKFHGDDYVTDPHQDATELLTDVNTTALGGEDFTGAYPLYVVKNGERWNYVGYRYGYTDNAPLQPGTMPDPTFEDIASDQGIIYVYRKQATPPTTVEILERFREKDNTSNILQNDNSIELNIGADYTGNPLGMLTKGGENYYYWGYQVDNDTVQQGTPPTPTLGSINSTHIVTYLYDKTGLYAVKNAYINGSTTKANGSQGNPVQVEIGDTVTYEIILNHSVAGAAQMTVNDVIPDGLTFVSQTAENGGVFGRVGQHCTWTWTNPPVGETKVTVTVTVTTLQDPNIYDNQAVLAVDSKSTDTNHTYHKTRTVQVVERFRELSNIPNILKNDNTITLPYHGDYIPGTDTPPATLTKSSVDYTYYGYQIGTGAIVPGDSPTAPVATILGITTDAEITYLYRRQYQVVEQFKSDDATPITLSTDVITSNIWSGSSFTGNHQTRFIHNGYYYDYIGYKVDGGSTLINTPVNPTFSDIVADHLIEYIYAKGNLAEVKLHLRQVVINHNAPGLPIPNLGYFVLTNEGRDFAGTTPSGTDNGVDYAKFTIKFNAASTIYVVDINDLVPQYYKYAGYVATDTSATHNPASRLTTDAEVDFASKSEWWVTVYIEPTTSNPGESISGNVVNYFGNISVP
jgi:uncharacterized repeat protein (TIGR01451 family)